MKKIINAIRSIEKETLEGIGIAVLCLFTMAAGLLIFAFIAAQY